MEENSVTHEELINTEEYKKAELECKQYNEKRSVILTMLRNRMKADKWCMKLKRWFDLQRWLLFCLLINNRVCRYFKYKRLKSSTLPNFEYEVEPTTLNLTRTSYDHRTLPTLYFTQDHSVNNQVLFCRGEEWTPYNWNYNRTVQYLEKGIISIKKPNVD